MHGKTQTVKQQLRKEQNPFDRVPLLEKQYEGETAYLVTCGPSLTSHNREELLDKLRGKLVIACKQAYDYVKEEADFHLLSVYNYQPYEYFSEDTIRLWQLTAMNMANEAERITKEWKQTADVAIPVYSTPWIQKHQSISYSRNFDLWNSFRDGKAIWGPGIMYETGFPLALHLGCKKIVTIGWDIGDLSKYPSTHRDAVDQNWQAQHAESLYKVNVGGGPEYEELKNTVECTTEMYGWLQKQGVEVSILSDINPADSRFKRITLDDLI